MKIMKDPIPPDHGEKDHSVDSKIPYERAKQVLARHLCGWVTGHHAPLDHMLIDANVILEEMHESGVRFHLLGTTSNSLDGMVVFNDV